MTKDFNIKSLKNIYYKTRIHAFSKNLKVHLLVKSNKPDGVKLKDVEKTKFAEIKVH